MIMLRTGTMRDRNVSWCATSVNSHHEWLPSMAWGACAVVCHKPCGAHGDCDATHYCSKVTGKSTNCEPCHICANRRDGVDSKCPVKCNGASEWDSQLVDDCSGEDMRVPAAWVGDGVCDASTLKHKPVNVDLNCSKLRYDGGDCLRVTSSVKVEPKADCTGHNGPKSWFGDGKCDAGSRFHGGNKIDFNCASQSFDGGTHSQFRTQAAVFARKVRRLCQ